MAGMRDTARQDNMIGLCLFSSSMADSKSAYTTTGAGISNRWLVGLWIADMSNRSIARIDHDHSLLHDVPSWFWTVLCDPKKSLQNQHFTFLARYCYSLHYCDERCDAWNRSNPRTQTWVIRIGLSLKCKCPPPIDCIGLWDCQWSLWWAGCRSDWQSSDRRSGPTMNTLSSLGDYEWYVTRMIE